MNYTGKCWKSFQKISEDFEKNIKHFREVFRKISRIIPLKISRNILENFENYFGEFWELVISTNLENYFGKFSEILGEVSRNITGMFENYFENFQKKFRKVSRIIT